MRGELRDGLGDAQQHASGTVMVASFDELLDQHVRVEQSESAPQEGRDPHLTRIGEGCKLIHSFGSIRSPNTRGRRHIPMP